MQVLPKEPRSPDPATATRELMSHAILSLGLWLGASGYYAQLMEPDPSTR